MALLAELLHKVSYAHYPFEKLDPLSKLNEEHKFNFYD